MRKRKQEADPWTGTPRCGAKPPLVGYRGVLASTKQEASSVPRILTTHTQVFFDPQEPE